VVATAADGTKEIVDHGVDGLLAEPGDVASLSRGVIDILSGRLRLRTGAKRERLLREFCQDGMVRAQERLYTELLAGKGFPGWSR
jgi:glycosyltransferase involved in cell wall biosynthesis